MQLKVTLLRKKNTDEYKRMTDFQVSSDRGEENFTRAVALEAKRHGGVMVLGHPRRAMVDLDEKTTLHIAVLVGNTCGTCGVEQTETNRWCQECLGRRAERDNRAKSVELTLTDEAFNSALDAL